LIITLDEDRSAILLLITEHRGASLVSLWLRWTLELVDYSTCQS